MKPSTRKTAVISFCVGVTVALAAYATAYTGDWFTATSNDTYDYTVTQYMKNAIDMTGGADQIRMGNGTDCLNLGPGVDTISFHSSDTNERINFSLDGYSGIKYWGSSQGTEQEIEVHSGGDVVITIGAGQ